VTGVSQEFLKIFCSHRRRHRVRKRVSADGFRGAQAAIQNEAHLSSMVVEESEGRYAARKDLERAGQPLR
jgi:hypothetical protein